MRKLIVALPVNRDFEGRLRLEDQNGHLVAGPFSVCGRADGEGARQHGNPSRQALLPFGDTPLGQYQMMGILPTGSKTNLPAERFGPYGVVVLKPTAGEAALADANGRFHIVIQGGKLGRGRRLRPTSGSLRLADRDQRKLVYALRRSRHCLCEFVVAKGPDAGRSVAQSAGYEQADPPLGGAVLNVATMSGVSGAENSNRFSRESGQPRHFGPPSFHLSADSGGGGGGGGSGYDGDEAQAGKSYSNVDTAVITKNEGGNILKGYVPSDKSGVTIGVGFDLGGKTAAGLKSMGLSQDLVNKLTPYLGLTGAGARKVAANLNVTKEEADQINTAAFNSYFNDVGNAFNQKSAVGNFSDLPGPAQTVIADLSYNMGSLPKKAPTFWKQVTSGDWQGAYNNLMNFSKQDKTLAARAKRNAALLKQAMDAGTLPKPGSNKK